MLHGTGVGRKVTAREAILVNRRELRRPREVRPRRWIPQRRSKRSKSKLSSVQARLLNQTNLNSARMSENESKILPRHRQRRQSRINSHHGNRHNRNATSNRSARRHRLRKMSLRSLPPHLKARARMAGRKATRRTKTINDLIPVSISLLPQDLVDVARAAQVGGPRTVDSAYSELAQGSISSGCGR